MKPKRIVFIGSSTIHGHGDEELGGFANRFRLYYEAESPKNFVYTLGIFGESTEQLIDRMRSELPLRKPHLCVVYPGFNDVMRTGSPNAAPQVSSDNWSSIQQRLLLACEACPLIVMTGFPFDEKRTTPYPNAEAFYLLNDAKEYTNSLKEVCTDNGVQVLDLWSLWSQLEISELLAEDGLHANSRGHKLIFEQFNNFMQEVYN